MAASLFALVLAGTTLGAPPPSAFERAAAAYAVQAEGAGLRTLVVDWRYERSDDEPRAGVLFELYAFPGRVRREYRGRKSIETRVSGTDGKRAWQIQSGAIRPALRQSFLVALRSRSFGHLLAEVRAGQATVEEVGGGKPGHKRLLVTRDDGEMITLDVHGKSGLIMRYEGQHHGGEATDSVVVELSRWTRREGQWLPGRVDTLVNGERTERLQLRATRVNHPIAEGFFGAPHEVLGPPDRKL